MQFFLRTGMHRLRVYYSFVAGSLFNVGIDLYIKGNTTV